MSGVKHFKDDDPPNGSLSPSKMPKVEGEQGEKLSRVIGLLAPGKEPPVIKPKPKPKPKPRPAAKPSSAARDTTDGVEPLSPISPGAVDPGPIVLNPDSLNQFGEVVDLDAVVRYQMLDNTPQKDKAALSQSKGLQSRRLPSHVATLVGDDRPPPRKIPKENKRLKPKAISVEEPDVGEPEPLTDEERKRKLMAKVGISQSNPLAALGNILRKGPRGSGRADTKPASVAKKGSFKGSKESLPDGTKDSSEPSRKTSDVTKSPKAFRFGIRRSNSRSKKGDDAASATSLASASDTSSISSLTNNPYVREEPMETEPSNLSTAKSAIQNGVKAELREKENTTATTLSTSTASPNTSKSGNRNSMYFKPADHEPLSGLFDAEELDALLLKANDEKETSPDPESAREEREEKSAKEQEKGAKEEEQEHLLGVGVGGGGGGGSGLRGSALRSSFRMYENRYKAETEKRKKDQSPLTLGVSTSSENHASTEDIGDGQLDSKSSDIFSPVDKQATSTPKVAKQEGMSLFSDEDDIVKKTSPVIALREKGRKDKTEQDRVRQRRKLFDDDELFQSDVPSRPQTKPKKVTSNWDAYAQAQKSPSHKSPSPSENSIPKPSTKKQTSSPEPMEEDKPAIATRKPSTGTTEKAVSPARDEQESMEVEKTEASEPLISESKSAKITLSSDTVPLTDKPLSKPAEKEKSPKQSTPPLKDTISDPLGAIGKPELDVESKKNTEPEKETVIKSDDTIKEAQSVPESTELTPAADIDNTVSKQTVVKEEKEDAGKKEHEEVKPLPEKPKSEKETLNERVANRIRQRKEREEQKSSKTTPRAHEARAKIESGKVSSVRSRFDAGGPSSSSPKTTTKTKESPRSRTKISTDGDKGQPSWASDLKKQRERKERPKEKETSAKVSEDQEDIPEWKKRMIERRKKAEASAKTPSTTSSPSPSRRGGSSTSSPSPSRRGESATSASALLKADKSPRSRKSRTPSPSSSPSHSRDTARSTKTEAKESTDKSESVTETNSADKIEETDSMKPEQTGAAQKKGDLPDLSLGAQEESKPDISSPKPEVTSPKPEITSPKPKIGISTKRRIKSSESGGEEQISTKATEEPAKAMEPESAEKPPSEESNDHTSKEPRAETDEDEVFGTPSEQPSLAAKTSARSPSPQVNSVTKQGSVSSDAPFRSRSISRSPTPTQPTGPLKTPTDSAGIPEWKKQVLQRRKSSSSPKKPQSTASKKAEPEVPGWKKELMAKKSKGGEESKLATRIRTGASSTPASKSVSTGRAGRKKNEPVPDFMKEFQSKKKTTKD